MRGFIGDLRITARTLIRSPAYTSVTIATLAVGIGVTTAIFSVVEAVLLRPLPYPEPDRIVQVRHVGEDGGSQPSLSYPNFVDLREETSTFEAMGAYAGMAATASGDGLATRITAAQITRGFFEALGVEAAFGRLPSSEELAQSSVAVVAYGYWQSRLGGQEGLSGAVVRIGGRAYDVVGVMPQGISFPSNTEVWLPAQASLSNQTRTGHNFQVIGRLADGVRLTEARAEASAVAEQLADRYGEDTWMVDAELVPLRDELVGGVRGVLYLLLGAAGLLLLIACTNVSNLLLTRIVVRDGEVSIRRALGATGGRLALQCSGETALLSLLGGGLGLLLASWGVRALLAAAPDGIPRIDEVGISWTVLLFAAGLSIVVAAALGLIPAIRASRGEIRRLGGDEGRGQSPGRSSRRTLRLLAAAQVGLTVVLLVGAGLLGRSLFAVLSVDPGYRTEGATVMDVWTGASSEGEFPQERMNQFQRTLLDRLPLATGAEEVGSVSAFPLSGSGGNGTFVILDSPEPVAGLGTFEEVMQDPDALQRVQALFERSENTGYAQFRLASEGYFQAMDIPLIRGRLFDQDDGPDDRHVAVISQSLARETWPNESPIGKFIEYGNMDGLLEPYMIVGVVGDVRDRTLEAPPEPTFYGNARQRPASSNFSIVLSGGDNAARTVSAARDLVRDINPDIAIGFRSLDEIFSASLAERRFSFLLVGVFGAAALLLAVMGVFGVISYLVSHRRREIGVRVAMGATRSAIRKMVVGQGAVVAGMGIAVGLIVVAGVSDLGRSFLYGIMPLDPITYLGVALFLLAVAIAAAWIPAGRAARVEPTEALKTE